MKKEIIQLINDLDNVTILKIIYSMLLNLKNN